MIDHLVHQVSRGHKCRCGERANILMRCRKSSRCLLAWCGGCVKIPDRERELHEASCR